MISNTVKWAMIAILSLGFAAHANADCSSLKGRKIRLSNGATLLHSGGDLFRAQGLESDTYNLHLNQRKYVLMRVNYEHFKCFG